MGYLGHSFKRIQSILPKSDAEKGCTLAIGFAAAGSLAPMFVAIALSSSEVEESHQERGIKPPPVEEIIPSPLPSTPETADVHMAAYRPESYKHGPS